MPKKYLKKKNVQKGGGCGCAGNRQSFTNFKKSVLEKIGQSGGGYSVNPEMMIAGLPIYQSYDDCCQPALVRGRLQSGSANGGKPVCGSHKGGAKSKKGKNSSRKVQKNKKSMKRTKKRGHKKKGNKKGGGMKSSPGDFPKSFETKKSVFTADMNQRTFEHCNPNCTPEAI